ncbi:MAG: DUF4215 domain-containing protein [Deltaproteobacteria bacterium]|nr:DUF4215 domain-containing protein [Deltaproteobacteria bacterium]
MNGTSTSGVQCARQLILALAWGTSALAAGCGDTSLGPPEITALRPEQGFNDRDTRVTVSGVFQIALTHVDYRDAAKTTVEPGVVLRLGALELEDLEIVGEGEIRATVPPGLEADERYMLSLSDASGREAQRANAFLAVAPPRCGDGRVVAGSEECDDGGTTDGDGCSALCVQESGWLCVGSPSTCQRQE